MITEDIVFAIDDMINLCSDSNQALGMASIREMLCDFDADQWASMNADQQKEWLAGYLSCSPKKQA